MLVYGVMVTQLFLVQSFKVRVLVDQRKTSHFFERFFYFYKDFFQLFSVLIFGEIIKFTILGTKKSEFIHFLN